MAKKKPFKLEYGEWQTDKDGRRFRRVGEHSIEYEPTILTTRGELTKAQHEMLIKEQKQKPDPKPQPVNEKIRCPFRNNAECKGDQCALFLKGAGCLMAHKDDESEIKNTENLMCPFDRNLNPCNEHCALFKDVNARGCSLAVIRR